MKSRMDEFREFVSRYPKLREEVRSGNRTWQNIYEEWVVYGETDAQWEQYRTPTNTGNPNNGPISRNGNNINVNMDGIRNIVGYIQRLNPDSINRTLNTVQKVIQIAQSFGSKNKSTPYINSPYDDWWD